MSCWKELADLARMEVLLDDVTMSLVVLLVVVSLLLESVHLLLPLLLLLPRNFTWWWWMMRLLNGDLNSWHGSHDRGRSGGGGV